MEELRDYSGEFRPGLEMTDFSKAALVRLWRAAAKGQVGIDGTWYTLVSERWGDATAKELSREVWKRVLEPDNRRARQAMNISGDDIASMFKVAQIAAQGGGLLGIECQLKDRNHGIFTVKRCRWLEWFERTGDTEFMKWSCELLEPEVFRNMAHLTNPKIEVTPLKLPPRKSQDEIACQWEFKLEA